MSRTEESNLVYLDQTLCPVCHKPAESVTHRIVHDSGRSTPSFKIVDRKDSWQFWPCGDNWNGQD